MDSGYYSGSGSDFYEAEDDSDDTDSHCGSIPNAPPMVEKTTQKDHSEKLSKSEESNKDKDDDNKDEGDKIEDEFALDKDGDVIMIGVTQGY